MSKITINITEEPHILYELIAKKAKAVFHNKETVSISASDRWYTEIAPAIVKELQSRAMLDKENKCKDGSLGLGVEARIETVQDTITLKE